MTDKRRCPNCGAYLSASDKECYVCGEVLQPADKPAKSSGKTYTPAATEPQKDKDFVMPVDHDEVSDTPFEERKPYTDNDFVQPDYNDNYEDDPFDDKDDDRYYYDEEDYSSDLKNKNKRLALICGIVGGVAIIIAAIVGVCFMTGVFGSSDKGDEITVYFDKPSVNINIMDDNGVVYNWGADVSVSYKHGGKDEETSAVPCAEYDNMWKCKIPADATDLYFSQTTGESIRTVNAKVIENDRVYYVTDILLNADDQLPMSSCALSKFKNLGVNAVKETEATKPKPTTAPPTEAAPTEEETEEETEPPTEKPTEALANPYNVSLPDSWSSGTTQSDNGNCITYYEKYNYKNYGSGMLLSIYTFKAGDNSYGDLNAKKILTASDGSKIVIVTPSDVECDDSDEKAIKKYTDLQSQTNQVISSISAN